MATKEEVEEFLGQFKVKMEILGILFRSDRGKNILIPYCRASDEIPVKGGDMMTSPFTGGSCTLKNEVREVTFRKEKFEYVAQLWVCDDTGEEFTTTEQDGASIAQVYNRYREKYGIPYTDEIAGIRQRYGLSCAAMSEILGFGPNQWRLYEQGEVPSVSNGRMIRSIMNPEVMLDLVDNSKNCLTEQDVKRVREKVLASMADSQNAELDRYESKRIFMHARGTENGFAPESLERLKNMLLFILSHCGDIWCTKMNKILFYIDFSAYKEWGMAISGLSYKAIGYGPVPERWDRVFSEFDDIKQIPAAAGEYEGIVLSGAVKPDMKVFEEKEIALMTRVCDGLKCLSARAISELSHKEDAWIDCRNTHETIPFSKAFSLRGV